MDSPKSLSDVGTSRGAIIEVAITEKFKDGPVSPNAFMATIFEEEPTVIRGASNEYRLVLWDMIDRGLIRITSERDFELTEFARSQLVSI